MVLLDNKRLTRRSDKGRWAPLSSPTLRVVLMALLLSAVVVLLRFAGRPHHPSTLHSPRSHNFLLVSSGEPQPSAPLHHDPGDSARLVDLEDFAFTINNPACNGSSPLVLCLVHSKPTHRDHRLAIRDTWGSVYRDAFKVLFLVGLPRSQDMQEALEEENAAYRDMVQGNFHDAYRNLTYKHVMALKWVTYFCPSTKYVLKMDDDVLVNTPALLSFVNRHLSPHGARRMILCQVHDGSPVDISVIRSFRSKWRVSPQEYGPSVYPTYCSGWAVLYSPDVVFRLYREAQSAKFFWVDDVFVTGILAEKAKFQITAFRDFMLSKEQFDDFLNNRTIPPSFVFGPTSVTVDEMRRSWLRLVQTKHAGNSSLSS